MGSQSHTGALCELHRANVLRRQIQRLRREAQAIAAKDPRGAAKVRRRLKRVLKKLP